MKRAQRWVVIGGCSWELAAVSTHRVPTLTELSRHHPLLRHVIMASLGVHLYRKAA